MLSTSLRILQINLNRSAIATESTLQLAIELKIDLVLIQEPWIITTNSTSRSILHPAFFQILPLETAGTRPRTLAYVANRLQPIVTISPESPQDPDFLVLDIIAKSKIQVYNIYNEKDQLGVGPNTLERCLYPKELGPNSILLGDFNTHHPWWDPLAKQSTGANELVLWLENNSLELINTPGAGTFYRPNLARESVLDLTLATSNVASAITDWQIVLELGSDHYGILFTIEGTDNSYATTSQFRFNTKKADWNLFDSILLAELSKSSLELNSGAYSLLVDYSQSSLQSQQLGYSLLQNPNLLLSTLLRDKGYARASSLTVTDFLD